MMKQWVLYWLLLYSPIVIAQEEVTEQQLESLAELLGEDIDDSYLQQLYYLQEHPISVNQSTAEDWQQLKWLTSLQIESFLRYRGALGPLVSIYELQSVPLWDVATIKKVLPFITMVEPLSLSKTLFSSLTNGQHSILLRTSRIIEKQKGYNKELPNHYAGSPDRLLLRYRYQYKNRLQFGITAEKDPGEAFFKGAQSKGFDFYSFHVFARQLGKFKAIAVGDFTVNMGQGLIQWQALGFKKNAEVMQVKRQGPVLQPYSAATEYNFNRGLGFTWQKGNMEVTAFASQRKIDGSSNIDTLADEEIVTSFYNAGYHRTTSEIAKRAAIDYGSIGGVLSYKRRAFVVNGNAVFHQFSHTLQKSDKPYDFYGIEGKHWNNYSLDFSWTYRNLHAFGEVAVDKHYNKALLSGIVMSVDPAVDLSLLYRNIQSAYQTLWGNALTENTQPANEKGIYAGIVVRPSYGWRIHAYTDVYQFPWLKYRTDAPSKGKDFLMQITYQPNKQVEVNVRYKAENKERNAVNDSATHSLMAIPKQGLRINIVYRPRKDLTLKGRTELIWFNKSEPERQEGFLTYLQGDYIIDSKWKGNLRVQYFETGGYDSRVYTYENDVLYANSIPAFYDKGLRYYLNTNYKLNKQLSFWVRFAQTIYKDKHVIGSGLDIINGSTRSEYKLQMRYNLN
jgi:hypothetical protein